MSTSGWTNNAFNVLLQFLEAVRVWMEKSVIQLWKNRMGLGPPRSGNVPPLTLDGIPLAGIGMQFNNL